MNINTDNFGHYRVTDYGRNNQYQLFNRQSDCVYDITKEEYASLLEHRSIEMCKRIEFYHLRVKEFRL